LIQRPALRGAALLLLLVLAAASARASSPPTGWYPAAGLAWFFPVDSAVRETYSGGLGLTGGTGFAWSRQFGVEMRLAWFRRSGGPDARLAESADGRLTVAPFTAEFIYRDLFARDDSDPPRMRGFVAAGPAVVFSRERFTYRFAGSTVTAEGRRSDPAATLSAGLEGQARSGHLGWRLFFRYLLAGGHREVLRPGGRSDERTSKSAPTQLNIGFELTRR
jgi:hypothetical protein